MKTTGQINRRAFLRGAAALGALALAGCGQQGGGAASSTPAGGEQQAAIAIAGLKGPTTMGLANLKAWAEAGETQQPYAVTMYTTADEVVPLVVKGEIDCAALPCNLAATLYQKTEGAVQVAAINTLGVLYVLERGETVHSVADLRGKTLYTTGEGTTPEYTLRHILEQNGLDPDVDVDVQFLSAADEVVARLVQTEGGIAMLPQPMVTSAQLQIEDLRVALDITEEWEKVAESDLVTGVLMVRSAFAAQRPEALAALLEDYARSAAAALEDVEGTAALCEEYGVVAKAAIAQRALPNCNIVCITGQTMRADVEGYLAVLYQADPTSVGGALPGDDFYYVHEA